MQIPPFRQAHCLHLQGSADSMFLRNVGTYVRDCMTSHTRTSSAVNHIIDCDLPGSDDVFSCRWLPVIRRKVMLPS
jgi:hypothetical protein